MDTPQQTTNSAAGEPLSTKSQVLETGAAATQSFGPIKSICAHLNAFHVYASDTSRCVEANHYCSHLNEDVRQCLIYDTPEPNARLIGVEYMISGTMFKTLEPEERKLWHSHVFEVKSGMLIMPTPGVLPNAGWEIAETKEMEDVIGLYGKTYHFWQVDRGDKLPLGKPELMISFTKDSDCLDPGFKEIVGERDERFGVNHDEKAKKREYIGEPEIQKDADDAWKK